MLKGHLQSLCMQATEQDMAVCSHQPIQKAQLLEALCLGRTLSLHQQRCVVQELALAAHKCPAAVHRLGKPIS